MIVLDVILMSGHYLYSVIVIIFREDRLIPFILIH